MEISQCEQSNHATWPPEAGRERNKTLFLPGTGLFSLSHDSIKTKLVFRSPFELLTKYGVIDE